jgi:hypothetical protein
VFDDRSRDDCEVDSVCGGKNRTDEPVQEKEEQSALDEEAIDKMNGCGVEEV